MEPVQEIIEIPNFIDLVDFLGSKDSLLDIVKNRCEVKITLNNRKLYLFGEENRARCRFVRSTSN